MGKHETEIALLVYDWKSYLAENKAIFLDNWTFIYSRKLPIFFKFKDSY